MFGGERCFWATPSDIHGLFLAIYAQEQSKEPGMKGVFSACQG